MGSAPKTKYDGYRTWTSGENVTATLFNAFVTGLQTEYEERMEAEAENGVENGCAASIVSTAIQIATGVFWCEGMKREPAPDTAYTFSASDGSNTYYVYWDPTTETYEVSTSNPGNDDYIVFCQVDWNGADTLSNLVDLRPWGIVHKEMNFFVASTLATGIVVPIVFGDNFWIEKVIITVGTTGTAGSTDIDVHAGAAGASPSSIWSSGTKPTVGNAEANWSTDEGTYPDALRKIPAGYIGYIEIDAIATGATHLGISLVGRKYR